EPVSSLICTGSATKVRKLPKLVISPATHIRRKSADSRQGPRSGSNDRLTAAHPRRPRSRRTSDFPQAAQLRASAPTHGTAGSRAARAAGEDGRGGTPAAGPAHTH